MAGVTARVRAVLHLVAHDMPKVMLLKLCGPPRHCREHASGGSGGCLEEHPCRDAMDCQ